MPPADHDADGDRTGAIARLMKRLHAPVYESRLRVLVEHIMPFLREGDRVLDVGCGSGALGRALLDAPGCPAGVEVLGLERSPRAGTAVPVAAYDGRTIPHDDATFDVVLLADVLHHEADPHRLLDECARVCRRWLIVKDHTRAGWLAWARLALIDWAANTPHGVPCLYRYNRPRDWVDWQRRHGLDVEAEWTSLPLYPPPYDALFGGRLQYLAVLHARTARA